MRNTFIPPTALRMLRSAPQPEGRRSACARSAPAARRSAPRPTNGAGRRSALTINEFYGQTECNLVLASCAAIGVSRPGAIGKPVPGHTVAVIRPDGSQCAAGELGQIAIKRPDPVMFLEYWGKPDATREKFIGDWMTTGDQGIADGDGYVQFVGRDDDVITSAGYRIGPTEIEDCLIRHPAVALAAVVGKPDPVRTEIVKAFIVLKSGHAPSDALASRDPGLRQDAALRARISARGRLHRADADDHDRQGDPAAAAAAGVTYRAAAAESRSALAPPIAARRKVSSRQASAKRSEVRRTAEQQAVRQREPLAPDVIDHRMIGGGAGIGARDGGIVEHGLRHIEQQLHAG